jgi:hypothetical protein
MQINNSLAAVITGGASGLGKASAEALAAAGIKVAIFDINEEAGEAFAKELGGVFCNVEHHGARKASRRASRRRARRTGRSASWCTARWWLGRRQDRFQWDKATGGYASARRPRRSPSPAEGIFTACYRVASIGCAGHGRRPSRSTTTASAGCIILTSSAASQDGQIGQVAYGGGKGAVNCHGAADGARPDGRRRARQRDPAGHFRRRRRCFQGQGHATRRCSRASARRCPSPSGSASPRSSASLVLELVAQHLLERPAAGASTARSACRRSNHPV